MGGHVGTGGAAGQGSGGTNATGGTAGGTGGTGATIACTAPPGNAFALADFDGDGVTDCLLAPNLNSHPVPADVYLEVHKGLGGGAYSAAAAVTHNAIPMSLVTYGVIYYPYATADLSADGCADLVIGSWQAAVHQSAVIYLRSLCDGTFGPVPASGVSVISGLNVSYSSLPALGDFNGDGRTDLLYPTYVNGAGPTANQYGDWVTLSDVGNPPTPTLAVVHTGTSIVGGLGTGSYYLPVGIYDFNNDHQMDVVDTAGSGSTTDIVVGIGDGQGGFSSTVVVTSAPNSNEQFQSYSVSDVNMDGDLDISVVINTTPGLSPTLVTRVFYGDGAGHFSTSPPL